MEGRGRPVSNWPQMHVKAVLCGFLSRLTDVIVTWLGRHLGYLAFSVMALIGDPIY